MTNLQRLRIEVLQRAAVGRTIATLGDLARSAKRNGPFLPKGARDETRTNLHVLAREHLVYTRQRPESSVMYEHDVDKVYEFRIQKDEAIRMLAKMKIPLRQPRIIPSFYHTKSLDDKA